MSIKTLLSSRDIIQITRDGVLTISRPIYKEDIPLIFFKDEHSSVPSFNLLLGAKEKKLEYTEALSFARLFASITGLNVEKTADPSPEGPYTFLVIP